MHAYGPEMLEPVFHFLDELIRDQGDLLYMGLVYAAIPLIGWILCGGLRRKDSARQPHTSIIVIHTPVRPPPQPPPLPPPIIGRESDSASEDDEDSFAA
jgi:hypothetical protein